MTGAPTKLHKVNSTMTHKPSMKFLPEAITKRHSPYCPVVSLEEVFTATNYLHPSGLLGEGATGVVYEGRLESCTPVAVKFCIENDGADLDREIRIQSLYRHPHIVCVLGFGSAIITPKHKGAKSVCRALKQDTRCLPFQIRFIVFELAPGGDLFVKNPDTFHWTDRLQSAIDVTIALGYLHTRQPKVFHGDITSSNIVVTGDGRGMLTDFGLSCEASEQGTAVLPGWQGTLGYLDPEVAESRCISEHSEVYSLGMVFLELATGNSPHMVRGDKEIPFLDTITPGKWSSVAPLVDKRAAWPGCVVKELTEIAFRCIGDRSRRPTSSDIAEQLIRLQKKYGHIITVPEATKPKKLKSLHRLRRRQK